MAKTQLGLNPWLCIWIKPRQTIRLLVEYNVNYRFLAICAILGFWQMLWFFPFLPLHKNVALFAFLPIFLLISMIVEYLFFNLFAACIFWCGKLIKGAGKFKKIRAAIYWTSVPNIVVAILSMVMFLLIVNKEMLSTSTTIILLRVAIISQIVLGIWTFVIRLQALGEVQKFSAWMALLNLFLVVLALLIVTLVIRWSILEMTPTTA